MSSITENPAPPAPQNPEEKKILGPKVSELKSLLMGMASTGSLTGGIFSMAKAFHHPDGLTVAFWAAIIILVANCTIFAIYGRARMHQFLLLSMYGMASGVIMAIAGLGISFYRSKYAYDLHLAENGGEVILFDDVKIKVEGNTALKSARAEKERIDAMVQYLGPDITLAVEKTQEEPKDAVAKAARAAAVEGVKKHKPWWTIPEPDDFIERLQNVPRMYGIPFWALIVVPSILAAMGTVIYSILRATSSAGVKKPPSGAPIHEWAEYMVDRYVAAYLGKGAMVFIVFVGLYFMVYKLLPNEPLPGSPNWEYARLEKAEAKAEAEAAARRFEAKAEAEAKARAILGGKSKSQKSSTAAKASTQVNEPLPRLAIATSTNPAPEGECTRRKVGTLPNGQELYACVVD